WPVTRRSRRRSACPSSVADAAARPPRPPPGVSAGAIDGAAMIGLAGLPTPHSDIDQPTSERSAGRRQRLRRRPPASARSQPAVQSALHPVLLRIAEASQLQLPRPGPDGQPTESSQVRLRVFVAVFKEG